MTPQIQLVSKPNGRWLIGRVCCVAYVALLPAFEAHDSGLDRTNDEIVAVRESAVGTVEACRWLLMKSVV